MQNRIFGKSTEHRTGGETEIMDENDPLRKHAYSLEVSDYIIIPSQLFPEELVDLRKVSSKALAAVRKACRKGESVPLVSGSQSLFLARAMNFAAGNASVLVHWLICLLISRQPARNPGVGS